MQLGQRLQWRPVTRHDSRMVQQMVERAEGLARDSRARTRHAAVLVADGSLLAWAPAGCRFRGKAIATASSPNRAIMTSARTPAELRAITLGREGGGWRRLQGPELICVRLEAGGSVWLELPHLCPRGSGLALSLGVAEWIVALPHGPSASCSTGSAPDAR